MRFGGKQAWNLKMPTWKRKLLHTLSILVFHVSFREWHKPLDCGKNGQQQALSWRQRLSVARHRAAHGGKGNVGQSKWPTMVGCRGYTLGCETENSGCNRHNQDYSNFIRFLFHCIYLTFTWEHLK